MKMVSLKDDSKLYEELKDLMNLVLPHDFIDNIFYENLTVNDPNYDPQNIFFIMDEETPVGFIFGVERTKAPRKVVEEHREIMWIKAFGCYRKYLSDLEKLLKFFESYATEKGKKVIRISDYASWYLTPGVDNLYDEYNALLVELGYKRVGVAINYEIDLSRYFTPRYVYRLEERNRRNGIDFIEVKDIDETLLNWVEENFSVFWKTEAEMALKNSYGGVFIARRDENILGFSAYGVLKRNWFGPIGVKKDIRGKGIGTVLLFKTMSRLRCNGQRIVIIPWTSHLYYYTQLPETYRIRYFNIYQKELKI